MGLFVAIIVVLLLSFIIIIVGSIMQFSIFICTKNKIEFEKTLLPSLLSIVCFFILSSLTNAILLKFNINILNLMYLFVINLDFSFTLLIYGVLAYFFTFLIFIIIQGFITKLIDFNYNKTFKKILSFAFSVLKIKPKEIKNNCLIVTEKKPLSFFDGLLISLLSNSIFFFLLLFFLFLGSFLGNKII